MIRQPFKRRCAVCNRVNGLRGTDDQLRSHLLIGSLERLYGLPTELQHQWTFKVLTGLQGAAQWLQKTCFSQVKIG